MVVSSSFYAPPISVVAAGIAEIAVPRIQAMRTGQTLLSHLAAFWLWLCISFPILDYLQFGSNSGVMGASWTLLPLPFKKCIAALTDARNQLRAANAVCAPGQFLATRILSSL
jgi:hypothetical protein